MIIKPFDLNTTPDLPDEINAALIDAGLGLPQNNKNDSKIKTARQVFDKEGATLEAAAQQVSNLMQNADTAGARLKAVELTMKVHGILQEMDEKPAPQITINIIGEANKTLLNLVVPTN